MSDGTDLRVDPFPTQDELGALWRDAWEAACDPGYRSILDRSLCHVGAYAGSTLVGFVNVAWDGGRHAFLLDTGVAGAHRRKGIGTRLVLTAASTATDRGAAWLHVDYDPSLSDFYEGAGFRPTAAGLLRLGS